MRSEGLLLFDDGFLLEGDGVGVEVEVEELDLVDSRGFKPDVLL